MSKHLTMVEIIILLTVVLLSGVVSGMPPTPTIEVSNDEPNMGEIVYLSFSCNPNSGIYAADKITQFHWRAIYTYNNQEIVYEYSTAHKYSSDGKYTGTSSFTPPNSGKVTIQCWAHDEAGSESETAQMTIDVQAGGNIGQNSNNTPGFELIFIICALAIFLRIRNT